jgi:hypothetical protein
MRRTERERELERARRLRELTERALNSNQEARDRAEQLQRKRPKKKQEKAEGA